MIQSDLRTEPATPASQATRAALAPAHDRPASRSVAHAENPRRVPLSFTQLPFMKRDDSGRPIKGVAIDYWAYTSKALLISGWVSGIELEAQLPTRIECSPGVTVSVFRRPDVETAFSRNDGRHPCDRCAGNGHKLRPVRLPARATGPPRERRRLQCVSGGASRTIWLFARQPGGGTQSSARWSRNNCFRHRTSTSGRADFSNRPRGVPGPRRHHRRLGVNLPECEIEAAGPSRSAASARPCHSLASARHRAGLRPGLRQLHLQRRHAAGLAHPFRIGDEIRLVAFDGEAAYPARIARWEAAPIEPVSFARWAFELPTPVDRSPNGWSTMTAP